MTLRYQFEAEFLHSFTWEHVHNLPDDVAVKITKVKLLLTRLPKVVTGSCGYHRGEIAPKLPQDSLTQVKAVTEAGAIL